MAGRRAGCERGQEATGDEQRLGHDRTTGWKAGGHNCEDT